MNLKTAARLLGVHYQTAYRWVRGGELVAVKVGSGYEISDAALARFQARRAAAERVPDVAPRAPAEGDRDERTLALCALDYVLDRITIDADPLYQRAARTVAEVVGDCALLCCADGPDLKPVAYDHRDPGQAVLTGTMAHYARARAHAYAHRVRVSGDAVLVPQVSQLSVRATIPPQFHQYLEETGLYSAVVVPVVVDGDVIGTVFAARDEPGRSFSESDRMFLDQVAARVARGTVQAERGMAAWDLREHVVHDLHESLADPTAAELPETCEQCAGRIDDETLGVGFLDPELLHLAATKQYTRLLDADPGRLSGQSIAMLFAEPGPLLALLGRVLAGELDYCQLVARPRATSGDPDAQLMLHAGSVREPDATPRALVVVVHAVPALDPVPG